MSVAEHPAQIPVGIVHHKIAVADKAVGYFCRHSVDKTAFQTQQIKIGHMNNALHKDELRSFFRFIYSYNKLFIFHIINFII